MRILLILMTFCTTLAQTLDLSKPLKPCWDRKTKANRIETAKNLILLISDGNIEALNGLGQMVWKASDSRGQVNSALDVGNTLVVTYNSTNKTLIKFLSLTTGLSLFQKEIDSKEFQTLKLKDRLVVLSKNGIYFFDSAGSLLSKRELNFETGIQGTVSNEYIALATPKELLLFDSFGNIREIRKKGLEYEIKQALFDGRRLYLSEKSGTLIAFDAETNNVAWKYRLGAAIKDMKLVDRQIVVASYDNFLYLFSKSGEVVWKKRFTDTPNIEVAADVVFAYDKNKIYAIKMSKKPKIINFIESGEEIIKISLVDKVLAILKQNKISGFSSDC
ncbi:MAG: PQQ-binding-like beta-propeller repeat protein [Acidobacteriota bacterium]|nr:PQQ-binding-like beta-propeller repeat protein [Acidobacteriota bacterium]